MEGVSLCWTRRVLVLSLALLAGSAACAGPHTTGALWVQQYVDQEKTYFSTNDAQRHAQTVVFELSVVDEGLAAEGQRLAAELQACPGPSPTAPLSVSPGDHRRDALRIQAGDDSERLTQIARLAVMDWYLRRASATADARFCTRAVAAHDGTLANATSRNLLAGLPAATVSRGQEPISETSASDPPLVTLSRYAMGSVDTVTASAPLPQYLAWVYGGTLLADAATEGSETAAAMVDAQAPVYPDWEPDALYAALRGARP